MFTRIRGRLVAQGAVVVVTAVVLTAAPAPRPAGAQGYFVDPLVQLTANTTRPEPGVVQRHPLMAADQPAEAGGFRPDLYVRTLAGGAPLEASRAGRGRTTVGFFIGNEGSVAAVASTLVVMLPGGFAVGQIGTPAGFSCTPSAAGAGTQVKCTGDVRGRSWSEISLPLAQVTAPLGSYQIQAAVDPGNTIAESDEADNSATVTVSVVK